MSNSDTVLSSLADGVLSLTLNRPDKLNAFNEEMHLELRAGFEHAHADENVRAVLLTGAGRGFCAGQDLGDRDPNKGVPDLGQT
ncbi:MAG: enoyl-CoA hydratase/isomerase family protein, partial [Ensifer alkalisoli]|nr:enoyl-CoA hydratase/isomerase family protein [Sinorhizobium alkalisoli]